MNDAVVGIAVLAVVGALLGRRARVGPAGRLRPAPARGGRAGARRRQRAGRQRGGDSRRGGRQHPGDRTRAERLGARPHAARPQRRAALRSGRPVERGEPVRRVAGGDRLAQRAAGRPGGSQGDRRGEPANAACCRARRSRESASSRRWPGRSPATSRTWRAALQTAFDEQAARELRASIKNVADLSSVLAAHRARARVGSRHDLARAPHRRVLDQPHGDDGAAHGAAGRHLGARPATSADRRQRVGGLGGAQARDHPGERPRGTLSEVAGPARHLPRERRLHPRQGERGEGLAWLVRERSVALPAERLAAAAAAGAHRGHQGEPGRYVRLRIF